MALGLMRAVHEQGRSVPADLSVVGFDDTPETAFYRPPLTTVSQAFSELGRAAVGLTLRALGGEAAPSVPRIQPTLEVRASTGPPPA
jgi:DNA-binding LacI/PurR family transcriptional regulator